MPMTVFFELIFNAGALDSFVRLSVAGLNILNRNTSEIVSVFIKG